jgi:hypothetical protein
LTIFRRAAPALFGGCRQSRAQSLWPWRRVRSKQDAALFAEDLME